MKKRKDIIGADSKLLPVPSELLSVLLIGIVLFRIWILIPFWCRSESRFWSYPKFHKIIFFYFYSQQCQLTVYSFFCQRHRCHTSHNFQYSASTLKCYGKMCSFDSHLAEMDADRQALDADPDLLKECWPGRIQIHNIYYYHTTYCLVEPCFKVLASH